MAHLNVTLPEITLEQRTRLVKNLTETVGNILNFSPEMRQIISIRLDLYGRNEVARGGHLLNSIDQQNVYHIGLFTPHLEFHQKRALAEHLTNAFCDSLELKPERRQSVFVTIEQFSPENVAAGGRLMAEMATA